MEIEKLRTDNHRVRSGRPFAFILAALLMAGSLLTGEAIAQMTAPAADDASEEGQSCRKNPEAFSKSQQTYRLHGRK